MHDQLGEQAEQLTADPHWHAMLYTACGQASGLTDSAARALRVGLDDLCDGFVAYNGSRAA